MRVVQGDSVAAYRGQLVVWDSKSVVGCWQRGGHW